MPEAVLPAPASPKLLVVGWDGADWGDLHPLLDAGELPQLNRMVESGVMGRLATLAPQISPLLWTSIATGLAPDRHAVLDAQEPDPVTGGVRAVTRASRQAPAFWELLGPQGVRCHSIGWPATHPAQSSAGACVSAQFVKGTPNSVAPSELEAHLAPLRFSPQEWTGEDLRPFVPELSSIDQDRDNRVARLGVVLAEAVTAHAAATFLMETQPWDLTAIWFGAVGKACALFPSDAEPIYRGVVPGVYRFLDIFLGRLIKLAGAEARVVLLSDRGCRALEGRGSEEQRLTSLEAMNRPQSGGIFCASGPGIAHDQLMFGAGLLDIAPTVLSVFGFEPAPGMRGQPIAEVCARGSRTITELPQPALGAESGSAEEMEDLEALGYKDQIAAACSPQLREARMRRTFNLARVLLAQNRGVEAIPLLKQLAMEQQPAQVAVLLQLAHAYFQAGDFGACRELCEGLLQRAPDSPLRPLMRAYLAIAEGNAEEAAARLAESPRGLETEAALHAAIGQAYLKLQRWADAAQSFGDAIQADSSLAHAHEGLAWAFYGQRQLKESANAALDAIRLNYELPEAHRILGLALRGLGRKVASKRAFAASAALRPRTSVM